MGDNISIDWGLSNPNAFAKGWATQQAMTDTIRSNQAKQASLADPTNPDAALRLAVYDPDAAKSMQQAQDFQRAAQARTAASSYVADPNAQNGSAVAGFDPQMYAQVSQAIGSMDDMKRARVADSMGFLGSQAQQLLAMPQAQRAAALQAMAPQLAQHGIGPDQVQQYLQAGLSDQQLQGFIGQAVGVKGLIDQANKQRELGQTDTRIALEGQNYAETARHNKVEERKGVQDGFGNIINPISGDKIYSQGQAGGVDAGSASLADRNNNPGNIRDGKFAQSLPGYKGSNGGFAVFSDPQSGTNAQRTLLAQYVSGGVNTPIAIAAKYAPAGDGNNNPRTYAAFVAQKLGIGIGDKLTPDQVPALQSAMAQFEGWHGGIKAAGGETADAGGLSADAINAAAELAIENGGKMPAGFARNKAAQAAIQNRIASRVKELGLTMQQVIQQGQDTHAAGKVIQSFTSGNDSQTIQALNNTSNHLATLGQLADAMQNGDIPLFNRIANALARQTGKPAPTNFDAARQIIAGEIVKGIAGAGGGQEDRATAASAFSGNGSPAQVQGAVQTIKDLLASQAHTLALKYKAGTGRDDFGRFVSPLVRSAYGIGGAANAGAGPLVASQPAANRPPLSAIFGG